MTSQVGADQAVSELPGQETWPDPAGRRGVPFVKAHGAGNDFVLLPDPGDALVLTPELTRVLCDRRTGLGGDGTIRLGAGDAWTDVFMDYRNADGSLAEMCGNGVRCVAKYVADRRPDLDRVRVGTRGGTKVVEVVDRHRDGSVARVRVDMGAPVAGALAHRIHAAGHELALTTLSMGNPHAVLVVDEVAAAPLDLLGPAVGSHRDFPEGVNLEVIEVPRPDRVVGRIHERGVGETLASGTGACAMAVAAHLRGLARREVVVALPGGELEVAWGSETVHLTGPAVEVAGGHLDAAWLAGAAGASPDGVAVDTGVDPGVETGNGDT